jgi:periplasmic protein TonB
MSARDAEFEQADERSVRWLSFAGSLLLHAALIALILLLWQPRAADVPPIEVVNLVPESQGAEGAAGGGGGDAQAAASAPASSADTAQSEPAHATEPPTDAAAPAAVPAVPPPEPQATPLPQPEPVPLPAVVAAATPTPPPPPPPHPQRKPEPVAAAAPDVAPPQPVVTTPPPQPAPAPAQAMAAPSAATPSEVAAPPAATPAATPGSGSGPGEKTGPGQGVHGSGAGVTGDLSGAGDAWFDRVRRHLRRFMQNPNEGRKDPSYGTVWISITVARDGTVLDAEIAQSSGADYLDQSALEMVRAASPLPPVPDTIPAAKVSFKIPAQYEPGFFERMFH